MKFYARGTSFDCIDSFHQATHHFEIAVEHAGNDAGKQLLMWVKRWAEPEWNLALVSATTYAMKRVHCV